VPIHLGARGSDGFGDTGDHDHDAKIFCPDRFAELESKR
jgi:hypothetical protein